MTDVFISYSRKDKAFVQHLHKALEAEQREAWVDWESIPLTADWWAEIQEGIEAADAFVFVISPDSAESEVCRREIDHAAQHNKRLIPIVYREAVGVPEVLGHLNWIFFREADDFAAAFKNLLAVMDTDLEWVKKHTRLTRRAVEWDKQERNESYLLRGDDLAQAESQLSQPDRRPALTQLQQEYIVASQQQQAADLMRELEQAKALAETEKRRLTEQAHYNEKLRKRLIAIIVGLALTILLGVLSIYSYFRQQALVRSAEEVVDVIVTFADASTNDDVCWAGALNGLPPELVLPACKKAIELQPDVAFYYEGRGLIHSMMMKDTEAIADFKTAIEVARQTQHGEDRIPMWQDWLSQIEQHRQPFDEHMMQQLREDWQNEKEAHRKAEDAVTH